MNQYFKSSETVTLCAAGQNQVFNAVKMNSLYMLLASHF